MVDKDKQTEERTEATAEATAAEEAAISGGAEDLNRLLEDARARADEHWEQLLRTRAELDNLRKRHERELENAHKYALDGFVRELVPVWESLEMGLSHAQDESPEVTRLREGHELTLKMLQDVMRKFGVEQLNPVGEPFNPSFHQAMSMQPSADLPPNHVARVVQKGYLLNGRLVRPALVMVSQGMPGATPRLDEQA